MPAIPIKVKACLSALVVVLGSNTAPALALAGEFRDITITARISPDDSPENVRADAREVAQLLGIESLVRQLHQAKKQGLLDSSRIPSRRLLNAKIICLWQILMASEEVRALVAKVNADLSRSFWSMEKLSGQAQRTTNLVNDVNFLQFGILGTCKQSLRLDKVRPWGPQNLAITTNSISIGLSGLSLLPPILYHKKIGPPPTTLAHILSDNYAPKDAARSALWKFFNAPIPGSGKTLTRRQVLVKHWEDLTALETDNHYRLKRLMALPEASEPLYERLSVVLERIDLLRDFKCHIEEFDNALYELQQSITEDSVNDRGS